jgi:hypothetical protein
MNIASRKAFVLWREDSPNSPGKQEALQQSSKWLNQIEDSVNAEQK